MEQYIQISKINDFLFSPASLYLHSTYEDFTGKVYKKKEQIKGSLNHKNIDAGNYSSRKNILSGISVYSEKYNLVGKIDIFDKESGELIERKTRIKKIYQGYVYQLWAQYFCLKEMGYQPKKLFLHSLEDNQRYEIQLPTKEQEKEFENLIKKMKEFKPENLLKDHTDYFSNISIYGSLGW